MDKFFADGEDGHNNNNWDGGGGAGGSLWIDVTLLEGNGVISASGGNDHSSQQGYSDNGRAGGGGRIRIDYETKTFNGSISVAPGVGYRRYLGGPGSVYILSGEGDLWVEGGITTIKSADSYNRIDFKENGNGELVVEGSATVTEGIRLLQGNTLRLNHASALNNLDFVRDFSGTVSIDKNGLTLSGDLTVNGTLVVNQPFNVTGDVVVPGYPGVITHDPNITGSALSIQGDLTIDTGGLLDISGKGLYGGDSINAVSGQIETNESGHRCGGSHGGLGGCNEESLQREVYGDPRAPVLLGGGAISTSWVNGYRVGGSGGGAMRVSATTLLVDGQILADGGDGLNNTNWDGGGGAGGSLWLEVTTFDGTGYISASGGSDYAGTEHSGDSGRAGGGGRIRIDYETKTFEGSITTAPGTGYRAEPGSLGTVFMKSTANTLWVEGGKTLINTQDAFSAIDFKTDGLGELVVDGAATVTDPLSLSAGSSIRLTRYNALDNLSIAPSINGNLIVDASGLSMEADLVVGGTLTLNNLFSVTGDVSLPGYPSLITHEQGISGASLLLTGDLIVGQGATIDVSEKGLLGGLTMNPVTGVETETSYDNHRSGGSHGGIGGRTSPDTYGSDTAPVTLGGGGWHSNYYYGYRIGGAGGGAIRLEANNITLAGQILANGGDGRDNGNWDGGGGAGGSIWIVAQTLNSGEYVAGNISANGGNDWNSNTTHGDSGSGGGGGRIAIDVVTDNYTGSVLVEPGVGFESTEGFTASRHHCSLRVRTLLTQK